MSSRLLSSSIWSVAGNSAQYSVVFFLLVYLAHILTPHDSA
jgi:O-antigen/teichoic acid export membrane protein